MGASTFPRSVSELDSWRKHEKTTAEEARKRFVQFIILESITSSTTSMANIVFKGGNALRFLYKNDRSTLDLDFTAESHFPDEPDQIVSLLNLALKRAERQFLIKARCQSIQRKPPGISMTRPTYSIKVCYQFPGDRYYKNFDERPKFSEVVEVEISLNDLVCETSAEPMVPGSKPLLACSLEDVIAEKLRALLQQVPRNRSRPQDVFDVASMRRKHFEKLDLEKVGRFLILKSQVREIIATKDAFNAMVRSKAEVNYQIGNYSAPAGASL